MLLPRLPMPPTKPPKRWMLRLLRGALRPRLRLRRLLAGRLPRLLLRLRLMPRSERALRLNRQKLSGMLQAERSNKHHTVQQLRLWLVDVM